MTHPTEDELLLFAYAELPVARTEDISRHVASCAECRESLAELDWSRAALDAAAPARRRGTIVGATLALAVAATLAGVAIVRSGPREADAHWTPTTSWSATAGYVTGKAVVDIDAQLTRLEQERSYGSPN